jgi:hypothetical protein
MAKKPPGLIIPDEVLFSKILFLREQKVMLDRDLAKLYGVKTIRLREQVNRNSSRFPEKFMFRLTKEEVEYMVSQNAIPSMKHTGGALPSAFTEHGVLMLANVLKSEQAIQMRIRIIEVFVKIREMLLAHKDILIKLDYLEKQSSRHNKEIQHLFEVLRQLINQPELPRRRIGFKKD